MTTDTENAVRSVVKQFRGGEHALAGKRAAHLVYGNAAKPNQKLLDQIVEGAPGIDRYITAPDQPTPLPEDQGGNPLATQPENDPDQVNASNVSTDAAKDEQKAIDKKLEAGRRREAKVAEKKAQEEAKGDTPDPEASKLNPEGSSDGATDKAAGEKPSA